MDAYLDVRNISKVYLSVVALQNISFSVSQGEVHALLGENGAGKSTFLNILHGVTKATSGNVYMQGHRLSFPDTATAIKNGIIKVHQEINLIPEMTVAQNIFLGCEPLTKRGFVNLKQMNVVTNELLLNLKCSFSATDKVSLLSAGEMQMLQIAKALHIKAKVISFDEPTASLSSRGTRVLFDVIADLKNKGITVIYISHRLEEIFEIADRVTVLRDGKFIQTVDVKDTTKSKLVKSMVGRNISTFAQRTVHPQVVEDNPVLQVEKLTSNNVFNNISFSLNKGEILGFFGLVGAKRTDVMRSVFGADTISSGKVYINNSEVEIKTPYDGVANGIGLIPENRKEHGFVKDFTNLQNVILSSLGKDKTSVFINYKKSIKRFVEIANKVNLQTLESNFMTKNLSGGNQQKVILAKWLLTDVDIYIFDEPTKGIDVGAKEEIYKLMEDLILHGKSIIMVSSELTEVMGMSDRLVVMREGCIVANLLRKEFNEEKILAHAIGA